jgi:hypothetical protein
MDSSQHLCGDCSHSIEHAFAQLRSLTTSFLRGEIELRAFNVLTGEILVQHDMGVAQRKLDARLRAIADSGELEPGRHRLAEPQYDWPAANVPAVDMEESCMQPAAHDGSGDCGCPAVAED